MGKINDQRASGPGRYGLTWGFVVFTDTFMSGWGGAEGGRSLYALEVASEDEAYIVLASGKRRSEMKRGRVVRTLEALTRTLRTADHLAIVDRGTASRWYQVDGFAEQGGAK